MTEEAIKMLKRFEGCRLEAYKCPAGVWTIGYGHTVGVKPGQKITAAEADRMLREDAEEYERKVCALCPAGLNFGQLSALTLLAYNIGVKAFSTSGLHQAILHNPRDLEAIRLRWCCWVYAGHKKLPGLVMRREEEFCYYAKCTK